MTEQEWLNFALAQMYNGQWFGWRKEDDNGNKIEGHGDISKIDPNHLTKHPLIGFQLSFPISKMGDKASIEYMVNSIYSN